MRWILALHVIAMVAWYAGLFYLPRLFVYHTQCDRLTHCDVPGDQRFQMMERRLYRYIMWPAFVVTALSGSYLMWRGWSFFKHDTWLFVKLGAVFALVLFQFFCGYVIRQFAAHQQPYSEVFFRYLNEVPTLLLIVIVVMVVVRPF